MDCKEFLSLQIEYLKAVLDSDIDPRDKLDFTKAHFVNFNKTMIMIYDDSNEDGDETPDHTPDESEFD